MVDEDTIKMIEGLGLLLANHIEILEKKIKSLEEKNHDLYTQLGCAHNDILSLKIRVRNLEGESTDISGFEAWVKNARGDE